MSQRNLSKTTIAIIAITAITLFGVGCGSDTTVGPQTDVTKDSVDAVDTTTSPIDTNTTDTSNFCVVGDDVGCYPVTPTDTIDPFDPVPVDSVDGDTNTVPDYCLKPGSETAPACMYPGQNDIGN